MWSMRHLMLAATVALLLTGCADPAQPGLPGGSVTSPGSSAAPSSPPSAGTRPSTATQLTLTTQPLPPRPPARPGEVTVHGTVQEGVEASCLLLAADDGTQYLLVGGDRQILRPGATVVVEGRLESGMMTTCQQGTPLTVVTARPFIIAPANTDRPPTS